MLKGQTLTDNDRWRMRPRESRHLLEYRYHQAVPGTSHADYLEASLDHIRWMIEIHDMAEAEKARQAKKQ